MVRNFAAKRKILTRRLIQLPRSLPPVEAVNISSTAAEAKVVSQSVGMLMPTEPLTPGNAQVRHDDDDDDDDDDDGGDDDGGGGDYHDIMIDDQPTLCRCGITTAFPAV